MRKQRTQAATVALTDFVEERLTAILAPDRHLRLAGTYNVRDLGGYRTVDGRETRWRAVFRGDSPHRLTDDDQAALATVGLETVIDLRRPSEIDEAPNIYAEHEYVDYYHLPLINEGAARSAGLRTLDQVYQTIFEQSRDQIGAILQVFANPAAYPILVHCTAGKDRTGVIVALLLALAQVPDETIGEDYALSGEYLTGDFFAESRQRAEKAGIAWEQYQQLLICPPELMVSALSAVHQTSGGIRGYLTSCGLSDTELDRIREAIVS